ncbi:unnamed protein product [Aphanomyces euteiches]|uniref:Adenylate kinase n=1 Tax=Aphanomyces euteiches TaxID=100861 RepID=A0A6G0WGE4_9STRA|nr:hypothetical protein Ae201684_015577 [Aphanomyces euteiches]KAH9084132.1 hypothetical protein Ae201684P_020387 [Aphanomyces euteiches]KAH9136057.1 hypothetical protein AeRB84_018684 [Aphanomyces euteiches]
MKLASSRIAVIGITSCGKSTLALTLSTKLGIPFIDSDALFWASNWQKAADYVEKMTIATEPPTWVLAGHSTAARDMVFRRANIVVWLDYSLWTILWRLVMRTLHRWWTQEPLWGTTNRESLWVHFKLWSDESLVHFFFKSYWRYKKVYADALALHPHLQLLRFRHPSETQAWLDSLHQHS